MQLKRELENLYKLYGFNKVEDTENIMVFVYSHGYFNNAEIVCLSDGENNSDDLISKYQELGYSARKVFLDSVDSAHTKLFNGFFSTDHSRARLLKEYESFTEKQSHKLVLSKYEYVSCKYFDGNSMCTNNLIDFLYNRLLSDGPQLIILEAAAGFGKTCTSFEIVKLFTAESSKFTPIFTELSKNRKATLFRYVLLDEIDRNFTSLSSELVQCEITNGHVPLIIDGFDELISESASESPSDNSMQQFEETQTMLDTIAELFGDNDNTKVLLTSRKSSIFTGEIFDQWVETKLKFCNITRVSIEEPTVADWLGYDKTQVLSRKNVPLSSISNPILLSILRDMTFEEFELYCSDMNLVIRNYFESLLEREKERQSLMLGSDEQYVILSKLAGMMVDFDISSEEISFIKDMIFDINKASFPDISKRYIVAENRPTEDEFAMKLARHALLNRISASQNEIGFVNEFVFGIFISEAILGDLINLKKVGEKYIDISCTAYAVKDLSSRQVFFNKINPCLNSFNQEMVLGVDMKLNRSLTRDYNDLYLDSIVFRSDFSTGDTSKFHQCIFMNCTFNGCQLMTSAFKKCQFIECNFYGVDVVANTDEDQELTFIACNNPEKFARCAKYNPIDIEQTTDYEKILLEQYWKKGRPNAEPRRTYRTLLKGISPGYIKYIDNAITSLKHRGVITKDGQFLMLNMDKIAEIKDILGR